MNALQDAWGWQAAAYLFLGGVGGGLFASAALLALISFRKHRRTIAAAYWIASGCLCLGLALLGSELVKPLQALDYLRSFSNTGSLMAIGAWILTAALAVFVLDAFVTTARTSRLLDSLWRKMPALRAVIRRTLTLIGVILGFGVAGYTGFLLMSAPGIPFWQTPLLPCVFVSSALSAGSGVLLGTAAVTGTLRQIPRRRQRNVVGVILALVMLEALLVTLYISGALVGYGIGEAARAASRASALVVIAGRFGIWFWTCVVGLGLAVPLIVCFVTLSSRSVSDWKGMLAGTACSLIGDCALRAIILFAGSYADYIGAALASASVLA